jgi:hypothetical protein
VDFLTMSATLLNSVKMRKAMTHSHLVNLYYNHPHRLAEISTSGSLSYIIDEREFTSPGNYAKLYDFDIDFSDMPAWTRLLWQKNGYPGIGSVPVSNGEFGWLHRPLYFWRAEVVYGSTPSAVKIGTCTQTNYSRPTADDPWEEDSSDTTDIDGYFQFFLLSGGGGGAFDGREGLPCEISFSGSFDGTNSFKLPNLNALIERFPWDDPWASESAAFSDAFDDHLDTENAADGGGHSGSCSLELVFS